MTDMHRHPHIAVTDASRDHPKPIAIGARRLAESINDYNQPAKSRPSATDRILNGNGNIRL